MNMMELLKGIKHIILQYNIGGFSFTLFVIALIWLIVCDEGIRSRLWKFILMISVAVFYPFHAYLMMNTWGEEGYAKFLMVLPVIVLTCYAGANIIADCKTRLGRIEMLAALVFVMLSGVNFHLNLQRFDACNVFAKIFAEDGVTNPKVAINGNLDNRFPEGTIVIPVEGSMADTIMVAYEKDADYLIISMGVDYLEFMEDYGFEEETRRYGYVLYRKTTAYNEMWKITQYAGPSGQQSSFYTLTDSKGHLICYDGGWDCDADYVRNVINENGGHVDAWIVSHPHFDHCNALTTILESGDVPSIDVIYASDVDYDTYKEEAQDWDVFSDYERFLKATVKQNVEYLYEGDEIDLFGLDIKVFHDYTSKVGGDALNDGSLVIKVTGEEDSMLFCGDCGESQSDAIIEKHGNELSSDYLQLGHHGNGGLSDEFYRKVNPKKAFFDAPDWLMHPEEGTWYSTKAKIDLMDELGAVYVSFESAPNVILFR